MGSRLRVMKCLAGGTSASLLAFAACVSYVHATAGFAEWEVYTPGGNLISHTDIWKAEHGTCLRSDAQPDAGDTTIFVSFLTRWRYYPGHVVGDYDDGHFIFDEITREVRRYSSAAEFQRGIESASLRQPISRWLASRDGWQEAWLPFFVWRPCRDASLPSALSPAECEAALDPQELGLYKQTTWGRLCAEWDSRGRLKDEMQFLEEFCQEIRNAPE